MPASVVRWEATKVSQPIASHTRCLLYLWGTIVEQYFSSPGLRPEQANMPSYWWREKAHLANTPDRTQNGFGNLWLNSTLYCIYSELIFDLSCWITTMNTFSSPQYIVVHYLRYQLKNKAKAGDAQIYIVQLTLIALAPTRLLSFLFLHPYHYLLQVRYLIK